MNFAGINKSWSRLRNDMRFDRAIIALLSVAVVVLSIGWSKNQEKIVLVPPKISEQLTISQNSASEGYKKAWALYASELLGNVTPGNADFIVESFKDILSASAANAVNSALVAQVKEIKNEAISTRFTPRKVTVDPKTSHVFVNGVFETVGAAGNSVKINRTFEYDIEITSGFPQISWFDVFDGDAMKRIAQETAENRASVD